MVKVTVATLATKLDVIHEYQTKEFTQINNRLDKLNGCVTTNSIKIIGTDKDLSNHLSKHIIERDSKFKWIAAITSVAATIIAFIAFFH